MSYAPALDEASPGTAVTAAAVFCRFSVTFCAVTVTVSSAARRVATRSSACASRGNSCRAIAARSRRDLGLIWFISFVGFADRPAPIVRTAPSSLLVPGCLIEGHGRAVLPRTSAIRAASCTVYPARESKWGSLCRRCADSAALAVDRIQQAVNHKEREVSMMKRSAATGDSSGAWDDARLRGRRKRLISRRGRRAVQRRDRRRRGRDGHGRIVRCRRHHIQGVRGVALQSVFRRRARLHRPRQSGGHDRRHGGSTPTSTVSRRTWSVRCRSAPSNCSPRQAICSTT